MRIDRHKLREALKDVNLDELEEAGISPNLINVLLFITKDKCEEICPIHKYCPIASLTEEQRNEYIDEIEDMTGKIAFMWCPVYLTDKD